MILNCPEKWWRLFGFATTLYQQARGLPVGSPLPVGHIQPYTSYIIAEADLSALGTMASEPEARSKQKNLQVLEQGRTIAAFPITPGSPQHPAPAGLWRVVGSVPWPWYRHDEGVLSRGERTDDFYNLPPGPNSPVGILWAGLNRPGVGIHGSPVPETIGRTGSHGCIRLTNWDAAIFHTLISKNTPVTIR